jgi:hypothetical protein
VPELTPNDKRILQQLGIDLDSFFKVSALDQKKLIQDKYSFYLQNQKGLQQSSASTFPTIESSNSSAIIEHEASTSKINKQVLDYLQARGLSEENAISLVVSGFCQDIFTNLPFEFLVEAKSLLNMKIEGF